MQKICFLTLLLALFGVNSFAQKGKKAAKKETASNLHTFAIGDSAFLYDGKPINIRCGEMHFARIPREYWTHRIKMAKAMGLNAVCAYLFWNLHETEPDKFDFSGMADAAEFCRLAQKEGMLVILRPGPYSCAEWEFGGFPWWLLKKKDIKLRSQDPYFLERCRKYIAQVGKQLAPLQITKGGNIVMVQVENEYGIWGSDKAYLHKLRDYMKESGFEVPFFTCDPYRYLKNDVCEDIFAVVNFGLKPERAFNALRDVQKYGPQMCGEYYPAWFDDWGKPHHTKPTKEISADLEYMMKRNQSYSLYMVHGGTTFGWWAGAGGSPYSPHTSSYDYDAPVTEAGWETPKFFALRDLIKPYMAKNEVLIEVPKRLPVIEIPEFQLKEIAPAFDNLPKAIADYKPRNAEEYNLGYGSILYRVELPAGEKGVLIINDLHDYGLVFINGKKVGTLDRRYNQRTCEIAARTSATTLDIWVEITGRINVVDMYDRKGIAGSVEFVTDTKNIELTDWKVYKMPVSDAMPSNLTYKTDTTSNPAYYRGSFTLDKVGDSFFDMSTWGKGLVWLNGHCLGRHWYIGPTQSMYVPAPWLKQGKNEVVVLDLEHVTKNTIKGMKEPILDKLSANAMLSNRKANQKLDLSNEKSIYSGTFDGSAETAEIKFPLQKGRYFCFEALDSYSNDSIASCTEIYLLDEKGNEIPRERWKIVYADSEELQKSDGRADNVFDIQFTSYWLTAKKALFPHQVVIDLGDVKTVSGMRYMPRLDSNIGRVKNYKLYLNENLFKGL